MKSKEKENFPISRALLLVLGMSRMITATVGFVGTPMVVGSLAQTAVLILTPHTPIEIDDNADFVSKASIEG